MKRYYSPKTLKILFAKSGNQCAYPECENKVVEPATEHSDDLVIAQISHIYSVSERGPRGKSGLTEDELNSPENLILLCPNHHRIVDGQHESYPAEELKKWKRDHESKFQNFQASSETANENSFSSSRLPTRLIDQEIQREVNRLRKSRFFVGFDTTRFSLELAEKLAEREFSLGSNSVKSSALAWCVRLLLSGEKLQEAERYFDIARRLNSCTETEIAKAFISSFKGDKAAALGILADIDLPVSRTAALMVVGRHEGEQGAVDWLKNAEINATDLDSEGKYFLLMCQLKLSRWDVARDFVNSLSEEDLCKEEPALFYAIAMTCLLNTVPDNLCARILHHPPLDSAEFSLGSDETAISERRKAYEHFLKAAKIAQELNCSDAAKICEEYALWLQLRDPDKRSEARQSLEAKLRNPKSALHLVHLAMQFGIRPNLQVIEREIERQTALRGEITFDAARARLALILGKETPYDLADHIKRYENELELYFDKKSLRFLLIEVLSRAGFATRARECLATLEQEEISESEHLYLQSMITEAEKGDTIEFGKKQFEKTGFLKDLITLVRELDRESKWEDLCKYGEMLFRETGSLPDAEKLVKALYKTHRTGYLVEFVQGNMHLLEQSEDLRRSYCSALYCEGELIESRSALENLRHDQGNPVFHKLRIALAICSGDWNELNAIVAEEYSHRKAKTAQELIEIAELAVRLDLPSARELTLLAAEKGKDDAVILAMAYNLASEAGWENDAEAGQWIQKAASLSGDNGPVRFMSLKDVLNMTSGGDQKRLEISQQYVHGDIPTFLMALALNSSVFDLTFFPAAANLSEKDSRRKKMIPAYSGKRQPTQLETNMTVGIDATALITLCFLDNDLLDKVFDAFKTVYIPHSTLAWLFEEKKKITFHQPSRIKDAHKVRNLLATHKIEELKTATVPDANLVSQVGDELSVLITQARESSKNGHIQHLVVRSSPVYRVASLMEEEAELVEYESVLCSCMSVVDELHQKGHITAKAKNRAYDYIRIHEKPWPNQPEIADGAVLYLDELTVELFLHLGVLEKLKRAGFRPVVSSGKVSKVNELLSYEEISGEGSRVIENMRSTLNSGIRSGKVKVSRQFNAGELEEDILQRYLADMFSMPDVCDAVIVDNNCINQNAHISYGDARASVFSTLDVIDTLWSSNFIMLEERLDYRTKLLNAGYFFIPVIPRELKHHLDCSTVQNGKVKEVPGLKAIRENILCIKMKDCYQFPGDLPWIDGFLTAFNLILKGFWTEDADLAKARTLSDWAVESVDIPGWFRSLADKNKDNVDETEFEGQGTVRLLFPMKVSYEALEEYWRWAEDKILVSIKAQRPDLYSWLLEWYRKEISGLVDAVMADEAEKDVTYARSAWAFTALQRVPKSFQEILLQDPDFCEEHGLERDQLISFGSLTALIRHSSLCGAVRKVLSGVSVEEIVDNDGQRWELRKTTIENGLPEIVLSRENSQHPLPSIFIPLSPDRETRLNSLEKIASDINLPSDVQNSWRKIFEKRPLNDDEVQAFENDLANTPINIAQLIRGDIEKKERLNISSWIPSSEKYFNRLVGEYDGSATIRDYASGAGRKFLQELSIRQPYEGFFLSLFLSSHFTLTQEMQVDRLDNDQLVRSFDFLENHGDRISQIGAIEVGLRIFQSRPDIEPSLVPLIRQIRDDDVERSPSGFELLSALFLFVDSELSRLRLLSSKPPFYRRLAALSHASLIYRQLINSNVDIEQFSQQLFRDCMQRYYMQSLVDMRVEPGWNPVFSTAGNFKANFIYRILKMAEKNKSDIKNSELYELIFGTEATSICSAVVDSFFPYHLNPLDGTEVPTQEPPAIVSDSIERQMATDGLSLSSFAALLNSAYVFRLTSDHGELAAKVLRSCSYRITNLEDRYQFISLLNGLAMVAAVTRSYALANELRVLARVYRKDSNYQISAGEEFLLCLTAAASHDDPNEWKKFVSNWITEISFELEEEGADIFHFCSQLQYLCHIVPDLWTSCDKAYAALNAVLRNN